MPKHALLSASASHRWLNCPPSAKLCADIKDEASPYAKQGADAHSLCEFKVLTALGQHPPDPTDDLDYFDQEIFTGISSYSNLLLNILLPNLHPHCNKRFFSSCSPFSLHVFCSLQMKVYQTLCALVIFTSILSQKKKSLFWLFPLRNISSIRFPFYIGFSHFL